MLELSLFALTAFMYIIPIVNFLPFSFSKWQIAGLYLLLFGDIFFIGNFAGQIGVIFLLVSVSVYIACLEKNRLRNICIFLISYLFLVIWDNVFSLLWNLCISNVSLVAQNQKLHCIYAISSAVLLFLCCRLLRTAYKNSKFFTEISVLPKNILLLITFNLLICVIIFIFNIVMGEQIGYTPQTIGYNCILFGVYFLVSSTLIVKIVKNYFTETSLKHKQESYEQLLEYTRQIEGMYSSIRSFKHDCANIMVSLSGYIDNKDMDGLADYYYNRIHPLSSPILNSNYKLNLLSNIEIIELKSLISSKIMYAHEMGITVNIEIMKPIKNISIDTLDLARILGIFLDNAIEAALETSKPEISFVMFQDESITTIIISNNFIEHQIPISKLKEKGVSSKGHNRGIGLNNATSIISKYSNVFLDTEIKIKLLYNIWK